MLCLPRQGAAPLLCALISGQRLGGFFFFIFLFPDTLILKRSLKYKLLAKKKKDTEKLLGFACASAGWCAMRGGGGGGSLPAVGARGARADAPAASAGGFCLKNKKKKRD